MFSNLQYSRAAYDDQISQKNTEKKVTENDPYQDKRQNIFALLLKNYGHNHFFENLHVILCEFCISTQQNWCFVVKTVHQKNGLKIFTWFYMKICVQFNKNDGLPSKLWIKNVWKF